MADALAAFDLDNPRLPKAVKKAALSSGGFPYSETLDKDVYEDALLAVHKQLVLLQSHLSATGGRIVIVVEGRDAAGKGGAIQRYTQELSPRLNVVVALPKPNDREVTQWYFQRYVDWLPAAGETVLFDRSWYNRAGVEAVMGYCKPEQTERFLIDVPQFEKLLVDDGIKVFKFFLDIGREMQLVRFHDRRHDPLKAWKVGPVDRAALGKWDAYSAARDAMLKATDTAHAPWRVLLANDKRRTRLEFIRSVLTACDFEGKQMGAIGAIDPKITLSAPDFLHSPRD